MAQPIIQTSFSSGEWAPALNARVDLQKYHSAVALARNFFVDYRGGLSSRAGTKWCLQAYRSATPVRLFRFEASAEVNYVLEFGEFYIRFYANGGPILEDAKTITGATKANPAVITAVAHGYSTGDWVFISGVGGMTQLNNRYFQITRLTANTFSLQRILDGSNVNSSAYTTYTSGGTVKRVYTLPSPYAAADLALLKFAQSVNKMILTHPSYVPYELVLIAASNWTLGAIVFGSTVTVPSGVAAATNAAGALNVSYIVTALDANNQESGPSAVVSTTSNGGSTLTVSWSAVSGASSYNIYRTSFDGTGVPPTGSAFGFVQNVTGVSFKDFILNSVFQLPADFAQTPPIPKNPFQGAGVASATITNPGSYTTRPTATFAAAPAGGTTATGNVVLGVIGTPTVGTSDQNWDVGDSVVFPNGVVLIVATVDGSGHILTFQPITYPGSSPGSISSGNPPTNPVSYLSGPGSGPVTANLTWGVTSITITSHGAGYTAEPAITFSAGVAAATAVLEASAAGNPSVPGYFDQRLFLAAKPNSVQTFDAGQPGSDYNFNISNPLQPDDAITGSIKSQKLNTIRAMVPMSAGLIMFADGAAWLINGGSAGAPVSAIDIAANAQGYNGISDIPPVVANQDIIYVQAKGSIVRNLTYNYYTNIYTGTDITILSSHLFYGKVLTEVSYQEEPFKLMHFVRDDGELLVLTFLKEQELIGWTHFDTDGDFVSTASATEEVSFGFVDATYVCVERSINGNTVKYIERFAERIFPNGVEDAWCVDAGVQYDGTPATSFRAADHLAGETIKGLADGVVVTATVDSDGAFTLANAASLVTVGLGFTCQFKTLAIDVGQPTVQSREKQIPRVTLRVQETLGLKIGRTFDAMVPMKDLVRGNVGSMTNEVVTDLVTGDVRTVIDAAWTVPGQYCVEQSDPLPATILGVIPWLGDMAGR